MFRGDKEVAAKQLMLEDWSDESLYWYNQALRWASENEERTITQNSRFVPLLARPFAKPLLRHLVGKQPKVQGLGRLPYKVLLAELGGKLEDLEVLLGKSFFFFSERPSAADFAIYGVFCTGLLDDVTPDFEALISKNPNLQQWYKRVAEVSRHLIKIKCTIGA